MTWIWLMIIAIMTHDTPCSRCMKRFPCKNHHLTFIHAWWALFPSVRTRYCQRQIPSTKNDVKTGDTLRSHAMTLCHFIRLQVWQSKQSSWDNLPTAGLRRILPCYYWRMFSQQMSVKNLLSPCGRKMVTGLRDFGSIFRSGSIAMEIP